MSKPLITAEQCLAEAVRCEEIAQRLSPADPAKRIYERDAEFFLDAALTAEERDGGAS